MSEYTAAEVEFEARVTHLGDNLAVPIPDAFAKQQGIEYGDWLELRVRRRVIDDGAVKFMISGDLYRLSPREILEFCRSNEVPMLYVGNRNVTYCIHIAGEKYPVKWVMGGALDIDLTSFTTQYATRTLERLGFDIFDDWQERRSSMPAQRE